MKAKDKAVELVDKYLERVTGGDRLLDDLCQDEAKECAVIAVEEIINAIDWHEFETPNDEFNFWQQVKEEISKL